MCLGLALNRAAGKLYFVFLSFLYPGKPQLSMYLDQALSRAAGGQVAVVVCGPSSLQQVAPSHQA